jgi:hypothetical protein
VQHWYSIRGIAPSDIPRLALIEQQCKEFAACWSARDIAAELDNSLSRSAVAADVVTDEPLGYIVCWLVAGELQVGDVLLRDQQPLLLLPAIYLAASCDSQSATTKATVSAILFA